MVSFVGKHASVLFNDFCDKIAVDLITRRELLPNNFVVLPLEAF